MDIKWTPSTGMTYREYRDLVNKERSVKRTSKGTPVHLLVPKKRKRKKFLGLI